MKREEEKSLVREWRETLGPDGVTRGELTARDAEALERLLDARGGDAAGLALLLAWRAGLTRREIAGLRWAQVDFGALILRLPDREVPLDAATAERLRARRGREGDCVVASRRGRPYAPEALSALVRKTLDGAGLRALRLGDLRRDFLRRELAAHGWAHALRVSGLSAGTWRGALAGELGPGAPPEPGPEDAAGEEYRFWRVLQAERLTPAGTALWLTSQLGLYLEEIAALTWDGVDLDADLLRLKKRVVPLTAGTRRVLEELRARRRPDDDAHVLLTPRSRRPVDPRRLTTLIRGALIRGGIENRTARDFRKGRGP